MLVHPHFSCLLAPRLIGAKTTEGRVVGGLPDRVLP